MVRSHSSNAARAGFLAATFALAALIDAGAAAGTTAESCTTVTGRFIDQKRDALGVIHGRAVGSLQGDFTSTITSTTLSRCLYSTRHGSGEMNFSQCK